MRRSDSHDPELQPRPRGGQRADASARLSLRHSLARLVLSARAKRSWSQAQLAERAATTQARISDIENGLGNLRLDTLERVADALGLALMMQGRASAQSARGPVVVKRSLRGQDAQAPFSRSSPARRVAMMWQLAVDAWSFKGEAVGESRLQRDVVRVLRGGR